MFEIFIKILKVALPVFVFLTMLNVGLTQKVNDILDYLKDKAFSIRMLIANFILAPMLMWGMLQVFPIDPYLRLGLAIFSICAGAPFLIKLTHESEHDLALGASTMITLILATVIIVPLLLPLIVPQIDINGSLIAWTLMKQLILPIALGLLISRLLPGIITSVQPWIATTGNLALYLMIIATLVGYFPELKNILGQGAILIGLAFVLGAFAIGYLMGGRNDKDHLQDVGALATAQKNTAASIIIATNNFSSHPEVLVIIIIVNTLGLILLLGMAKMLSKDNRKKHIEPDGQLSRRDARNG